MKLTELLEIPRYTLKLPTSNKEISYRPFLVKEQRVLLQAQEEKDEKLIINSLMDVLNVCTYNEIDVKSLSLTDFEFLFLNIRAKSVGSNVNASVGCTHCGKDNEISIKIEDVKIDFKEIPENPIQISEYLWVEMKYPSTEVLFSSTDKIKIVKDCIKSMIFKDSVYNLDNRTPDEIMEFLDMLNDTQIKKLTAFIESLPRLYIPLEFNCIHCKKENSIKFESLLELFI